MVLDQFVMKTDRELIRFSFDLLNDIEDKLKRKILFYENQVNSYIQMRVDWYIRSLPAAASTKTVCRSEVCALIQFRLKKILENYSLFTCY
ncbi:hypothetical protein GKZ89_01205 [Bacillus mangrovi]|uniref:Uncharacterized protein n=1 Tax=Metabacillus mangrovi TaxID=1491830 RepID=A0A7X2S1C4_9BACI|nr:hypothetical protein [Metabacillus mangrovi]MTH52007.1 hypothetical protein [Metabacillus mangrovi]